jgi:hypothetical protein
MPIKFISYSFGFSVSPRFLSGRWSPLFLLNRCFQFSCRIVHVAVSLTQGIETNDLHARDGRDTKALNCKPITNLKKKYELPN